MRQILEYIKMAIENVVSNKTRSFLTMLGIIIGITSVLIVFSVGGGSQKYMAEFMSNYAAGAVYITATGKEATSSDYLTQSDIEALQDMTDITAVTMELSASGSLQTTRSTVSANIGAGNGSYPAVVPAEIIYGRNWNESDYNSASKVITIDSEGAKALFGNDNVVGVTVPVTIQGRSADFMIVGVTKTSAISIGGDVTASITMPSTALETLNSKAQAPYRQVSFLVDNPDESESISKSALNLISLRHGNTGSEVYVITDMGEQIKQMTNAFNVFITAFALLAGISLIVAGIGVMNIMLVSVTERTKEIGIRKALGAKTRVILFQFMVESATLSLLGGIIGIILGVLLGKAVCSVLDMEAVIKASTIWGTVIFSTAIGLFFGIYPARKAARLNPIDALRSQ